MSHNICPDGCCLHPHPFPSSSPPPTTTDGNPVAHTHSKPCCPSRQPLRVDSQHSKQLWQKLCRSSPCAPATAEAALAAAKHTASGACYHAAVMSWCWHVTQLWLVTCITDGVRACCPPLPGVHAGRREHKQQLSRSQNKLACSSRTGDRCNCGCADGQVPRCAQAAQGHHCNLPHDCKVMCNRTLYTACL